MNIWIFSVVLVLPLVRSCPSSEALFPCTCDWPGSEGSAYVTCEGLDNEQVLVNAASSLKHRTHIYSVTIKDSVFNFIPSDAFKGGSFVELSIEGTSLMALTDSEIAFEGLEEHLEILLMTDSVIMNGWDWSIFKNLNKLMRFEVIRGNLESIGDLEQYNMSSIRDINLDGNSISYMHPHAFASFSNLMIVTLSRNHIVSVARSMMPDPALQLVTLDLSYNDIEQLPADMFSNMPVLKDIAVSGNRILVLNENTFLPVWEQLDSFIAMGNDLRCDCRMSWILDKKSPSDVRAICYQPPHLKGKNINSLQSKDLWCYR